VTRILQLEETGHSDQPVENTEKNEGGELDRVKLVVSSTLKKRLTLTNPLKTL
jgi:hypothetical protein